LYARWSPKTPQVHGTDANVQRTRPIMLSNAALE
jgi:hypothetical protein